MKIFTIFKRIAELEKQVKELREVKPVVKSTQNRVSFKGIPDAQMKKIEKIVEKRGNA